MRRLNLSTKMLVAALPLILAVVTLLAISVRSDLADIDDAEHGAELGRIWQPLIDSLGAIEYEASPEGADDGAARTATNGSVNEIGEAIETLRANEAATDHLTSARSALSAARRNLDMAERAPDLQTDVDPADAYAEAGREVVAVGQLLPSEAGEPELGSELLAVVKLAEAELAADQILLGVDRWQADPDDLTPLSAARSSFANLSTLLGEFEAIAPTDWSAQFRQDGFISSLASYRSQLDQAARAAEAGNPAEASFDRDGFKQIVDEMIAFQTDVSTQIVSRAEAQADDTRSASLRRIGLILAIVLVAVLLAWLITRSITRRIRAVARGANQVSTEQLPSLVEALRDPRGTGSLPDIEPMSARGSDELSELAEAFNAMQDTLTDVAHEQVEVLRRGVSDLFVTMARRNRSLIDRQLAMLDDFEADVDDPDVLSKYYQLDHMATRMRRNSESLLVLASAEPKRRRVKATEVDDVVRAAIGEVEDYRRIEIEALESLRVRGNVVADVSHLLAELLDNATAFSPPDSHVRVGGRTTDSGYMIRIVDNGVGIGTERLQELNTLLKEPPVIGLSVESTLGMSVVSLLANKHNISVTLAAGNPGLIVDVVLPDALVAPVDPPAGASNTNGSENGTPPELRPEGREQAATAAEDDQPVASSDFRTTSLNLAAFQNGMQAGAGETGELARLDHTDSPPERAESSDDAHTAHGNGDQSTADEIAALAAAFEEPEPTPPPTDTTTDEIAALAATFDEPEPTPERPDDIAALAATFDEPEPTPPPTDTTADEIAALAAAFEEPNATPGTSDDDTHETGRPDRSEESGDPGVQPGDADVGGSALPPPSPDRRPEFSVPPAPPLTADGPSRRPVAPDNARTTVRPEPEPSLPARDARPTAPADIFPTRLPEPNPAPAPADIFPTRPAPPNPAPDALPTRQPETNPPAGNLPTRAPGQGSPDTADLPTRQPEPDQPTDTLPTPRPEPDPGADTLPMRKPGEGSPDTADLPIRRPGPAGPAGPDRLGGDALPAPAAADDPLPTRSRTEGPVTGESPLVTSHSEMEPDDLRNRLRAFQAKFRSALTDDHPHDTNPDDNQPDPDGHDQFDLGGDRR